MTGGECKLRTHWDHTTGSRLEHTGKTRLEAHWDTKVTQGLEQPETHCKHRAGSRLGQIGNTLEIARDYWRHRKTL